MTRLLRWSITTVTLCAVLLLGARLVGHAADSLSVQVLDADQCIPEPCWHGIRPGQTSIEEAEAVLARDDSFGVSLLALSPGEHCWYRRTSPVWRVCVGSRKGLPSATVGYVVLKFGAAGLTTDRAPELGNALLLFGQPQAAMLCSYNLATPLTNPVRGVIADVYFGGGVDAEVYVLHGLTDLRLDPTMPLFLVNYSLSGAGRFDVPRWRGFTKPTDQRAC